MSLYLSTTGCGPDIVLLHGWALHAGVWTDLLRQLRTRWRVTCIDLPGHGMSPAGIDLRDLDVLCAELDQVIPISAVCVGWSMGGLIALAYAMRYPQSLRRLILVASQPCFTRGPDWPYAMPVEALDAFAASLTRDCRATLNRFLALQVQGSRNKQLTLRRLMAVLKEQAPRSAALREGLALLRETDLRDRLSAVICPVRLILGERDALVPAQAGPVVSQLLKDGHYKIIPKAGHAPFLSHAKEFMEALHIFLNE